MTMWSPSLGDRPGPRYRVIVDALADDVAAGRLRPGERLPTHRELAEQLSVTVGTVTRAYVEAARRGLVTGQVGRGTFVRGGTADGDGEEGGPIDLAQNHPPSPPAGLHRELASALASLARPGGFDSLLDYPVAGGGALDREAGASFVARAGVKASPERVVVCSGSQHGLLVLLATLLQPGDLLLTESLTYAGLKSVAGLLHLRVAGVQMDGDGLLPDALDETCRKQRARALYVIPTLHNPTTAVMPADRRLEILEVARRHGLSVVEDDVHGLLAEHAPAPLASLDPASAYYLTSTSKTLAPGLRVAYVLGPAPMIPRLVENLRATTWAVAPLTAALASAWIGNGTADTILSARRAEARARQALAREILAGADCDTRPEAYYLWLRLPEPWRRDEFVAAARARGVLLTSAAAFAVGRDPVPHAVRLCLGATKSRARLERGLEVVAELLKSAGESRGAVV